MVHLAHRDLHTVHQVHRVVRVSLGRRAHQEELVAREKRAKGHLDQRACADRQATRVLEVRKVEQARVIQESRVHKVILGLGVLAEDLLGHLALLDRREALLVHLARLGRLGRRAKQACLEILATPVLQAHLQAGPLGHQMLVQPCQQPRSAARPPQKGHLVPQGHLDLQVVKHPVPQGHQTFILPEISLI